MAPVWWSEKRLPNSTRSNGIRTLTEPQVTRRARAAWVPPGGPLGELTRASEARAAEAASRLPELEAQLEALLRKTDAGTARPSIAAALAATTGSAVAVIAEIKRRSPSKGVINEDIDAGRQAAAYEAGGAAAVSVLTEPERFGGSLNDLRAARAASRLPLLRKDFITHRVQLVEARIAGASAVLLIARALEPDRLRALAASARTIGLEVLAEVRSEAELEVALSVPHAIIGVNNRDLEKLVIENEVGARLIPQVPGDRIAVYESGVRGRADVERAAELGADAVLVGSLLSGAGGARDAQRALHALAGVARIARHGRGVPRG